MTQFEHEGTTAEIIDFLRDNPGSTTGEIARTIDRPIQAVSRLIAQLRSMDRVVASGRVKETNVLKYSLNTMPFGCSNPALLMFNRLLSEVRNGTV